MSDGTIAQIVLPNGSTYDLEDSVARTMDLTATYTAATYDLELVFTTAANADNEEF